MGLVDRMERRRNWWKVVVLIFTMSIAVVGYIDVQTYEHAPPNLRRE